MPILLAMACAGLLYGGIIVWETRHERRSLKLLKGTKDD